MALFHECMQGCARKVDTADIVRDGDFSPIEAAPSNDRSRASQTNRKEADLPLQCEQFGSDRQILTE